MKLGDYLKELRLSKNMNQEYLSSLTGVDSSKISRVERYNQPISFSEACLICIVLGSTPNEMWENIKDQYKQLPQKRREEGGEQEAK